MANNAATGRLFVCGVFHYSLRNVTFLCGSIVVVSLPRYTYQFMSFLRVFTFFHIFTNDLASGGTQIDYRAKDPTKFFGNIEQFSDSSARADWSIHLPNLIIRIAYLKYTPLIFSDRANLRVNRK